MTKFNFTAASQAHIGTAGYYQLSIDHKGTSPTYIKSVEGGYPKANVIEEQVGQDLGIVKHTSTAEIDPMSFEIGMQSGIDILRWIQDSWRRNFSRRDGAVSHGNFDAKTVLEHEFYGALLTETTFPTLDAAGKEGAYLKFKIQPERVELKPGNKEKLQAGLPPKQKLWMPSSFRFELDGVDTSGVSKVDSFTVHQTVKPMYTGADRFPQYEPVNVKFPDLTIHMSKHWSGSIMSWYDDFVVKGHQDPKAEKNGSIVFLAPNLKDEVYRVNLFNVGIKSFTVDKASAAEEQMKKVKFELYVGSMDLDGDGALALE
jgi:hypothetical protein